jgi:4-aminobutyrate aminotransferase-like enzyme
VEVPVPRTPAELVKLKQEYLLPCVKHYYERPMNLVSGSMQHLKDSEGKEYLDFFAGILSVNSGHSNPEINAAVHAQLDRLQHLSTVYLIEPMLELARELAEVTPGALQKSFFCNSGTEAIDTALLTAKLHTGCEDVIALRHSYHGRSHVAIGVSGQKTWRLPVATMGNVHFTHNAYCYRCAFGLTYPSCELRCARDLEELLQTATTGRVAALIAEPIQGVGGFITPPPEYFSVLFDIVKRYGGVTIADEVQTGWGRTGGHLFGMQHWNVEPDMMVFAKGLGNGFAIGAFIARAEIADAYQGPNISTFGGNPLAMVAAHTNIEYIRKHDLAGNAERMGRLLWDGLQELREKHRIIGDVRGKGLMIGVELVRDRGTKERATTERDRVVQEMFTRGVLLLGAGRNAVRFAPPLVLTRDQADIAVRVFDEALSAVTGRS